MQSRKKCDMALNSLHTLKLKKNQIFFIQSTKQWILLKRNENENKFQIEKKSYSFFELVVEKEKIYSDSWIRRALTNAGNNCAPMFYLK